MSQFNYRASFANSTSRLVEIIHHLGDNVPVGELEAEMVKIAACSNLKWVEGKSIALALIAAEWIKTGASTDILAKFDFSKVEAKDLYMKRAETLLTCAKQAYACRSWATLKVKA